MPFPSFGKFFRRNSDATMVSRPKPQQGHRLSTTGSTSSNIKYQATADLCIQNEKALKDSAIPLSNPLGATKNDNPDFIFDDIPPVLSAVVSPRNKPLRAVPMSGEAVLTFQHKHLWGPSEMFRPASFPHELEQQMNAVEDVPLLSPITCNVIFFALPAPRDQAQRSHSPMYAASTASGGVDAEELSLLSGHSTPTHDSQDAQRGKPRFFTDAALSNAGYNDPDLVRTRISMFESPATSVLRPSPSTHVSPVPTSATPRVLSFQNVSLRGQTPRRSAGAGYGSDPAAPCVLRRHSSDDYSVDFCASPRTPEGAIEIDSRSLSTPSGRMTPRRHVSTLKLNTWLSDAHATRQSDTTVFIKLRQSKRGVRVESHRQVDVLKEDMVLMT